MCSPFQEIRFNSASEFLASLRPSHPRWLPHDASIVHWNFRGQGSSDWTLTPSAWRASLQNDLHYADVLKSVAYPEVLQIIELNRRFLGGKSPDAERFKHQVAQRRFEYLQVRAFLDLADELGFDVPGGFLPDTISRLVKIEAPENEPPHPGYALAQHHGMPTRLLDWTQNPLVAAFFAAENPVIIDGEIAVWALHPLGLIDTQWKEYRVPRSAVGFVHAQAGLFTYHKSADIHFVLKGTWPVLEAECDSEFLKKLTLRSSEAPELRRLLFAEGISRAHLMPTFDNIKATLRARWKDHYDAAAGDHPSKEDDT